jgi:hypothetical protein
MRLRRPDSPLEFLAAAARGLERVWLVAVHSKRLQRGPWSAARRLRNLHRVWEDIFRYFSHVVLPTTTPTNKVRGSEP